jgi:predicted permease
MTFIAIIRSFGRAFLLRLRMEREMEQEMRLHIDLRAADLIARGLTPAEADRRARDEFGDAVRWKEQGRDARGLWLVDDLCADLRYATRSLRRSPGFALVAVLSLALGIGANTAIFSLIDLVLLKPLPVRDPDTLVQVVTAGEGGRGGANVPWFKGVAERRDLFSDVFAIRQNRFKVEVRGQLELVAGQFVTGTYYQALGVYPVLGRVLLPEDQRDEASNPVAVISYGYWQRRFGGDSGVLGTLLTIDRQPYTIVGVTGPDFFGLQQGWTMDVTMPLVTARYTDPRNWVNLPVIARLRGGVDRVQAETSLGVTLHQFASNNAVPNEDRRRLFQRVTLLPFANGQGVLREEFLDPLRLLMGGVSILLLIACVNLAGLLIARNAARQRELAVRVALGASRLRIVRQLLTESALLAVLGVVPAVAFAWYGGNVLLAFVRPEYWGPSSLSLTLDARVLGFATAAAVVTTVLFGVLPACQATRLAIAPALASGFRQTAYPRIGLGRGLVISQFALSLLLVAAAVLFVRTLVNLAGTDAGFTRDGVLLVNVDEPGSDYANDRMRQFQREMRARLAALPGVVHATVATITPLNGNSNTRPIVVHGHAPRGHDDVVAQVNYVGPSYFEVFGIPLVEGRSITDRDEAKSPRVVVVSEGFARHYFGTASALGRLVAVGPPRAAVSFEIVGVAREVRYQDLRTDSRRTIYVPLLQALDVRQTQYEFALRTAGDPAGWVGTVRAEISRGRPTTPIAAVRSLTEQINTGLTREWLLAVLGAFFAGVALMLAAIGVYGLLAYAGARRVREIGIRLALGARPRWILWMTLRECLVLAVLGAVLGLGVASVALRGVGTFLFGLSSTDLGTLLSAAAVLVVVALFAGFVPARRAASVDPLVAIRCE